ncbi:MAG: hypothetical protein NUW09_03485 [Deltaproteobacteria bacterium]|nr:hypothetical protein [Deltaproteobacteria bacterium]
MGMNVFFTAFVLFFAAVCLHIAMWRLVKPRGHISALAIVFLVFPAILSIVAVFLGQGVLYNAGLSFAASLTSEEWAAAVLMHCSFSSAYILTYPAIQAGCPSLRMLLIIGSGMPEGITHESLRKEFGVETLFLPRIKDMLDSGFVKEDKDNLMLTATGRILAGFFALYRKAIGLPAGRG